MSRIKTQKVDLCFFFHVFSLKDYIVMWLEFGSEVTVEGRERNVETSFIKEWLRWSYLSEQEGDGSEGKRPAVLVAEVGLVGFGSVQHFVVNVGDVQHQSHHQRETCEMEGNLNVLQKSKLCRWYMIEAISIKHVAPLFIDIMTLSPQVWYPFFHQVASRTSL